MNAMILSYENDLRRVEARIERLVSESRGAVGAKAIKRRIVVLRDERRGLKESIKAMNDYVREVSKRSALAS